MISTKLRCVIVDDEPLAHEVLEEYIQQINGLELVGKCYRPMEVYELLQKQAIDLIFMDIAMPQLSGIDFLRSLDRAPMVIFVTAYPNFALEGYELEAIDYLLKPVTFSRFFKAVHRAFKQKGLILNNLQNHQTPSSDQRTEAQSLSQENEDGFLFLKAGGKKMQKIFFKEILYIESLHNNVKIQLPDKEVIAYQGLSEVEELLPEGKFLRVHRSFIIGLDKVDSFSPAEICIRQFKIPVGRNYREETMKILGY